MEINLFQANIPFLYPLKTSKNQRFSDTFRGEEINIGLKLAWLRTYSVG